MSYFHDNQKIFLASSISSSKRENIFGNFLRTSLNILRRFSFVISILSNNTANAGRMACHSYENESSINSERYVFLSRLCPSIFLPECMERCTRASSFVSRRRKTRPILLPSPCKCRSAGWMRRHPGSSLNIQWR